MIEVFGSRIGNSFNVGLQIKNVDYVDMII